MLRVVYVNLPLSKLPPLDPRIAEANKLLVESGQPEAAARLYRQAVAEGAGQAASRLAVMAAVGIARPADWNEALDYLATAATLGDEAAQGQLLVFSGSDVIQPAGRTGDWTAARRKIDADRLLSAPIARSIRNSPAIVLIDALATPAMCRWLIQRAAPRLERALIGEYDTGNWVPDPIRTGFMAGFGCIDTDLVFVAIQERLARATRLMVHQQEAPFILSYERGQEYRPHYDYLLPGEPAFAQNLALMGQRVATCLTWLNDDYEGGETSFPRINWKYRGKVGDAMLFLNVTPDRKPDPMSLHAGLPPSTGRKWLLSQWIRDREQPIV
jgi:prolyl 4-hydroxylase